MSEEDEGLKDQAISIKGQEPGPTILVLTTRPGGGQKPSGGRPAAPHLHPSDGVDVAAHMTEKKCNKCQHVKPLREFSRQRRTYIKQDGTCSSYEHHRPWCKACSTKHKKHYTDTKRAAARAAGYVRPAGAMKCCAHCHETKPAEEFSFNFGMADNLDSWCKACENARRHISGSPSFAEKVLRYPKKTRVGALVRKAVFDGKITKPASCSWPNCTETKLDGHHADYDKPFEVEWLCRQHHRQAHLDINAGLRPALRGLEAS